MENNQNQVQPTSAELSQNTLFGKYSSSKAKNINNSAMIVSALATVGAWSWCFTKEKGFWAYVGYGFLEGLAGTLVGGAGAAIILPEKK